MTRERTRPPATTAASPPARAAATARGGLAGHPPTTGGAARGPKHAPRAPFALVVLGLLGGGLVLLLGLNTASAANELQRHDLTARDADLAAALAQGRNDLAASSAPNALAQAAGYLGMVPAGNPVFITIGPDGQAHVVGSGAPASAIPLPPVIVPVSGGNSPAPEVPSSSTPKPSGSPSGSHSPTGTTSKTPTPTVAPTATTTVTLPGGAR